MKSRSLRLGELVRRQYPALSAEEVLVRILSGRVLVDGVRVSDRRQLVKKTSQISFAMDSPFVSRGGEKLARILKQWQVAVAGKVWLDAGSSAGGFSDCLLQNGARLVHAVDVGYNQLDYRLRTDKRIRVRERTNIMTLRREDFTDPPECAVCDLSFRSLQGAADQILQLTGGGSLIALVKPQFEYRQPPADFNGVVKELRLVKEIVLRLAGELAGELVFVQRIANSPLTGRKGNRELFFELGRLRVFGDVELAGMVAEVLNRVVDG